MQQDLIDRFKPDARLGLILAFIASISLWKSSFLGLIILFVMLFMLLILCSKKKAEGSFGKGIIIFALIWPLLKIIISALPTLYLIVHDLSVSNTELKEAAYYLDFFSKSMKTPFYEACMLFLRLVCLIGIGILLTAIFSSRQVALAFTFFLRPVGKKNAWKIALALSLMLQYIRRIPQILKELKDTARLRGLPDSGLAYWILAIPRLLSLLGGQILNQSVAIASRNLDHAEAWSFSAGIAAGHLLMFFLIAFFLILLIFI